MSRKRHIKLSKTMSYFLRHRPDEANLVLDSEGMVPISDLIGALNKRRSLAWVTERDIDHVVEHSEKKRFHIKDGRIGARYGHNRKIREVQPGEPITPPDTLYHGTPRRVVASIMKQGLLPQGRQFVHLSPDIETAQNVGGRRDHKPTILIVHAQKAHAAGIKFYAPTDATYLAERIPPEFIEVKK